MRCIHIGCETNVDVYSLGTTLMSMYKAGYETTLVYSQNMRCIQLGCKTNAAVYSLGMRMLTYTAWIQDYEAFTFY